MVLAPPSFLHLFGGNFGRSSFQVHGNNRNALFSKAEGGNKPFSKTSACNSLRVASSPGLACDKAN